MSTVHDDNSSWLRNVHKLGGFKRASSAEQIYYELADSPVFWARSCFVATKNDDKNTVRNHAPLLHDFLYCVHNRLIHTVVWNVR